MNDILDQIPENDKCCINCARWCHSTDTGDEYLCQGEYPCLNYHMDNKENFFVPDESYLKDDFGTCDNCANQETSICGECNKLDRDNMWEWGG